MCVEQHEECPLPSWSLALPVVSICYSHTWSQSPLPHHLLLDTPHLLQPLLPLHSHSGARWLLREPALGRQGAPSSHDPHWAPLQQHSPREPLAGSRQGRLGSRDIAISHTASCPGAVSQLGSFGNRQPGGWRGSRPVSPTQASSHGEEAVVRGTQGSRTVPLHITCTGAPCSADMVQEEASG